MKPLQWFRMYAEAVDDDKLRLLAFEDRWHYVAILCLKAGGVLDSDAATLERRVAIKLGLLPHDLGEVKRRLMEVGLIDKRWQPRGWDNRQYASDSSAERTRRWREKRHDDVTVTDQSRDRAETDTETEQNKRGASAPVVRHQSLPIVEWAEWVDHRRRRRWPIDPTTLNKQLALLAEFDTETQRQIIAQSINAGWQGLFRPKGQKQQAPKLTWQPPPDEEPHVRP